MKSTFTRFDRAEDVLFRANPQLYTLYLTKVDDLFPTIRNHTFKRAALCQVYLTAIRLDLLEIKNENSCVK